MTKTDAIRKALARGRATFDELRFRAERLLKQIIGRHKLRVLLATMKHKGEIRSEGRGKNRWFELTAKGRVA